jgi:glycosyltransferase involved in cell wall biosynthesis
MPAPPSPVVGYYGAIAEWFDFELLAHAARQHRDWQFVLIGLTNRKADLDGFTGEHPNVHYLGEKPYESLAAYLAHFDVGIIPFLVNDVTNAVSPVKLFEYAAGGKPIVSTAFTEVCQYSEVLTAGDGDEFVQQLRRALQLGRDAAYQEKLARLAESNSWQDRAARILKTIEEQPGRSARGRRRSEAAVG